MPTPIACGQVLQFRRLPLQPLQLQPLQLHDGRLPELPRTNCDFPALAALKRLEVRKVQTAHVIDQQVQCTVIPCGTTSSWPSQIQ